MDFIEGTTVGRTWTTREEESAILAAVNRYDGKNEDGRGVFHCQRLETEYVLVLNLFPRADKELRGLQSAYGEKFFAIIHDGENLLSIMIDCENCYQRVLIGESELALSEPGLPYCLDCYEWYGRIQ